MGPEGNILVNSSVSTFQQGLTHSALSQTLLNFETKEELKETGLTEKVSFGPKEVDGKLVSYQETREKFFEEVDRRRKDDLYSHEVCHEGCKRRGCEEVSTFDGLWKVQVSLDVFKMPTANPVVVCYCGFTYISLPLK